jgi:hypothetical protein
LNGRVVLPGGSISALSFGLRQKFFRGGPGSQMTVRRAFRQDV